MCYSYGQMENHLVAAERGSGACPLMLQIIVLTHPIISH